MAYRKDYIVTAIFIGVIILMAAAFTWSVWQKNNKENTTPSSAERALVVPEGKSPYTDLAGNTVLLSDEVGNVLVVNSWASWSPSSKQELANLAAVANQYAQKGVKVLAINRAEPAPTAERFLKQINATGAVKLVLDPDDHYYNSIDGYAMPETVFYDRAGNIVHHHHGPLTPEQMKEYVEQALASDSE